MRIQHNIAAMNAYRNYNLNTSAVTKNLEKLSSGYKINRAGDDAAGLAISEKMRAQISGLEAASKNVKDGISLVKTAEGAMQEVQDMLNRMVTLATQSANGTYDNETDRAALQQEVDQLNSEIDRIADSANFNGIKLLDGSLDANGRRAVTETVFAGMKIGNNVNGTAIGDATKNDSTNKIGGDNDKGGILLTGAYSAATTGKPHESDDSVRYHKDAATAGKTSFTVDLDGLGYDAAAGTSVKGLQFALQGGDAKAMGTGNHLSLDKAGAAGKELTYDIVADGSGKVTSEAIASAIMEKIANNGGKVYIQTGTLKGDGTAGTPAWVEYTVTQDGDKLKFEMTDDGYATACNAAQTATAANPATNENYFQGNFNFSLAYKQGTGGANLDAADADNAKLQAAFSSAINDKLVGNAATCEINEGTTPMDTIYAQAYIRFNTDNAASANGVNKTTDYIADGKGFKLGDEYYIFAGSDATYNTEYADNVKVVDIRDLTNLTDAKKGTQEFQDDLRKALDRLSVAAKDNEMFDVQVEERGTMLVINERTTYEGDANLTETDWGLENQIQVFDSATSKTEVLKEAGKALTLQIGDTSEEFNQLKVNIGDVHAEALGVSGLSIADQESAGNAINTIRSAINQVSSIRGTLGATQNRLEHTSNNLSVMTENIQDAESTIRDTDIAEEMMSYTKNNILVQSAQAMLAQANQIPQGVLQLLG
ncbi:flagellin N-terminal helical domain-containing protein [Lawsonibacter sp. JLR.KK007]|uniref:flagellin N-terminal helical domain-containing protein n=1 Tax=Lawsonibacter sp. JLR.KK007 TaxID=3114293 RepID=UPI002FEF7773